MSYDYKMKMTAMDLLTNIMLPINFSVQKFSINYLREEYKQLVMATHKNFSGHEGSYLWKISALVSTNQMKINGLSFINSY
ncbi:hypothetical protein [Virgibacillus sp. L01]|uniref:hypothetical protein n=1 Tax=Virgibacillus sp. L01 TaxID=3457429 RepID=UPI003FCF0D32